MDFLARILVLAFLIFLASCALTMLGVALFVTAHGSARILGIALFIVAGAASVLSGWWLFRPVRN